MKAKRCRRGSTYADAVILFVPFLALAGCDARLPTDTSAEASRASTGPAVEDQVAALTTECILINGRIYCY